MLARQGEVVARSEYKRWRIASSERGNFRRLQQRVLSSTRKRRNAPSPQTDSHFFRAKEDVPHVTTVAQHLTAVMRLTKRPYATSHTCLITAYEVFTKVNMVHEMSANGLPSPSETQETLKFMFIMSRGQLRQIRDFECRRRSHGNNNNNKLNLKNRQGDNLKRA